MEENSLDDFFAKKDKTKKKSKSKSTTGDILPQGDELQKKTKKKKEKKEKESKENEDKKSTTVKKDEEEWEDFEQEEEKDYSGLRIGSLQVSNKEEKGEEEENASGGEEEGEDGEPRERKEKGADGPWNQQQGMEPMVRRAAPSSPPPEKKEPAMPTGSVSSGKYVPPSRRGLGSAVSMDGPSGRNPLAAKKKKNAPNIRSEEDFPTLGGFGAMGPDGAGRFEEVRGGRLSDNSGRSGPAALELGNKFGALQDQ